jgi:glycosyltransferase involved in cell wall biosynthesis
MKILFITREFPPIVDGVGDYTFHLATELAKRNFEILVVCSRSEAIEQNLSAELPFKLKPIVKDWTLRGIEVLKTEIRQFQPDWISIQYVPHGFHSKAIPLFFIPFVFWIRANHYKLQITFHEIAIGFEHFGLKYWIQAITQRIIAWTMAFFSNQVVTSTGLYVKILRPFNNSIEMIHIGSNFKEPDETEVFLQKAKGINIASFANRITIETLEAIKLIIEKGKLVQLIGLGQISEDKHREIMEMISQLSLTKYVSLTGRINDNQLFGYLKHSDLYLQTEWTNQNGKGGVALKSGALAVALQAGLPVITIQGEMTDTDILIDREIVVYSKPDAASLAQTILDLLDNSALTSKLSANAHRFFEDKLSWKKIGSQYSALFSK